MARARHYRRGNFLEAAFGINPSYNWRSTIWGRELLQRGIRWRVGYGDTIRVYHSYWIPRHFSFKPVSPILLDPQAAVDSLITDDDSWNVVLLQEYFMEPGVR